MRTFLLSNVLGVCGLGFGFGPWEGLVKMMVGWIGLVCGFVYQQLRNRLVLIGYKDQGPKL